MGGGVGDGSWSRSGLEGINTKMIKPSEISTWKWKLFLVTHSLLEKNIFHQGFPSFLSAVLCYHKKVELKFYIILFVSSFSTV